MPISKQDTVAMMRRASNEIKALRREIDALAPKADAYETIRKMVGAIVRPGEGGYASPDLAWVLDNEAQRLEAELKDEVALHPDLRPSGAPT